MKIVRFPLAGTVSGEDPVPSALAALGEFQNFRASIAETVDERRDAVYFEKENALELSVYCTAPTTPAGAAAFLRHVADYFDEMGGVNDTLLHDVFTDAIRNAVSVLEREALS